MPPRSFKGVTIIELIIAIILLAVIILGINNIDIFSRYHFITTDRRAKVQNDASRCLEHITKSATLSIGNEAAFSGGSVVALDTDSLSFFVDADFDGLREADTHDHWINYKRSGHTLTFCGDCGASASCGTCLARPEVLSGNITSFSPAVEKLESENYVDISITACYIPDGTCDGSDNKNPAITMSTSIALPGVAAI